MIQGIEEVILKEKPAGVVVYGDTNSTLAGALAAAKLHVPVFHIEAGLRSFNKKMPEEVNRIGTDHVSTLLFSPTETGVNNLREEGIVHHETEVLSFDQPGVYHCGDIMYDNTLYFRQRAQKESRILERYGLADEGFVLGTVHRPANTDVEENLQGILEALSQVASDHGIPVILPLHPRTRKILRMEEEQVQVPGFSGALHFIPAVSFLDMVRLEAGARLIMTDSGGVQKEAWFMEKPVVVLREETEWVEIIEAGNGLLTGARKERIIRAARHFLNNPPSSYPPIFGDGHAARQILAVITGSRWQ
jgi:UDP-GlcNAc3NAcA epimerase